MIKFIIALFALLIIGLFSLFGGEKSFGTASFSVAIKAYNDGYTVKKRRIDGTNWTVFHPNIKNPENYIFTVFGTSDEDRFLT